MLFRMRADVQVRIVRLRSSLNHLGSVVTSPRLGAPSFTFSPVQVWPLQPFDAAERVTAKPRLGWGRGGRLGVVIPCCFCAVPGGALASGGLWPLTKYWASSGLDGSILLDLVLQVTGVFEKSRVLAQRHCGIRKACASCRWPEGGWVGWVPGPLILAGFLVFVFDEDGSPFSLVLFPGLEVGLSFGFARASPRASPAAIRGFISFSIMDMTIFSTAYRMIPAFAAAWMLILA